MPKRKRLSTKQIAFLRNVFFFGLPMNESIRDLNIRLTTFDRWLTKPLFLHRLQMHINHYHFVTRMELARNAPQAVSGLNFLSEKSLRHKEVRQACNDLLNLHSQYGKPAANVAEASCFGASSAAPGQKRQKKAKFWTTLAHFWTSLASLWTTMASLRTNLATQKHHKTALSMLKTPKTPNSRV